MGSMSRVALFFCRYCGYVDSSKDAILIMFFSNSGLFQLKKATDGFLDGTFDVRRHPFSNLLSDPYFKLFLLCFKSRIPKGREEGFILSTVMKSISLHS